jgi:hypothetical protein
MDPLEEMDNKISSKAKACIALLFHREEGVILKYVAS